MLSPTHSTPQFKKAYAVAAEFVPRRISTLPWSRQQARVRFLCQCCKDFIHKEKKA